MTPDPRTRLILLVMAVVAIAFTSDARALGVVLGVIVVTAVAAGREWLLLRVLRLGVLMGALVFLLSFYGAGWQEALTAVLRLVAIGSAAALVFGSTPPEDLGSALVAGGVPYPAAFVLMAAMQFVPVIARRAAAVRDAQRARGIRLDVGLASLRNYHVLALPVLYQSFKLADELAEALEARGFSRSGRTYRHSYRLGRLDWILLAGGTVATLLYVAAGGR